MRFVAQRSRLLATRREEMYSDQNLTLEQIGQCNYSLLFLALCEHPGDKDWTEGSLFPDRTSVTDVRRRQLGIILSSCSPTSGDVMGKNTQVGTFDACCSSLEWVA